MGRKETPVPHLQFIIIIIIHEFYRDASLELNFRAAVCHVLH